MKHTLTICDSRKQSELVVSYPNIREAIADMDTAEPRKGMSMVLRNGLGESLETQRVIDGEWHLVFDAGNVPAISTEMKALSEGGILEVSRILGCLS